LWEVVDCQLAEPETWTVAGDFNFPVNGGHRNCTSRKLADSLSGELGGDHRSALFEHLDIEVGADGDFSVGSGDTEAAGLHLTQDALEYGKGRSGTDRSPRTGKDVSQVVSFGSDAHSLVPSTSLLYLSEQ
jgi:hypothetical protein